MGIQELPAIKPGQTWLRRNGTIARVGRCEGSDFVRNGAILVEGFNYHPEPTPRAYLAVGHIPSLDLVKLLCTEAKTLCEDTKREGSPVGRGFLSIAPFNGILYAVATDHTAWYYDRNTSLEWTQVPPLPQP